MHMDEIFLDSLEYISKYSVPRLRDFYLLSNNFFLNIYDVSEKVHEVSYYEKQVEDFEIYFCEFKSIRLVGVCYEYPETDTTVEHDNQKYG